VWLASDTNLHASFGVSVPLATGTEHNGKSCVAIIEWLTWANDNPVSQQTAVISYNHVINS